MASNRHLPSNLIFQNSFGLKERTHNKVRGAERNLNILIMKTSCKESKTSWMAGFIRVEIISASIFIIFIISHVSHMSISLPAKMESEKFINYLTAKIVSQR